MFKKLITAFPGYIFFADDISLLDASLKTSLSRARSTDITDLYLLALGVKHQTRFVTLDTPIQSDSNDGGSSANVVIDKSKAECYMNPHQHDQHNHRPLQNYKITAKLGQGGMGEVYRATDTKLDREVAIKVLPESFAHDKERLARFECEAKTLSTLNHPNIAGIYGLEITENSQALVLELVEGEDLSERLKRGPLPVDEALDTCKQIAEALEAAHAKGIIHRDLKPGNI